MVFAISMLLGAGAGVFFAMVVALIFYKKMMDVVAGLKGIPERVDTLEVWIEAQIKAQDMSERGRLGQQARQDNAQAMESAMEEGQAVILGKGSMEEKKNALLALIQKYPNVAMRVAQRLNRQYGISKFIGVPEDEFLQMVAQLAAQALQKPQEGAAQGELAY